MGRRWSGYHFTGTPILPMSLIYQGINGRSDRAEDFTRQLERIEYEATRVALNPNFDLTGDSTQRNLMREKSIDLMTGIIKFFTSALIYFNYNFFGSLSRFCANRSWTHKVA